MSSDGQGVRGGGGRGGPGGRRSRSGRVGGRAGGRGSKSGNNDVPTSQMASMSLQDTKASGPNQGKKGEGNKKSRRRGREDKKKSSRKDPKPPAEKDIARMEKEAQEEAAKNEQRKRHEAQQKRKQEEREAVESAKQAREKQAAALQTKVQDAMETLEALVQTTQQRKEARELFAAESLVQARKKFEAGKKSLKSDLKKCTAFVKKVKSGSAWAMKQDELTNDIATLNLSRYVDEVATAITESKWKVVDMPVVITLCRAMHERYAEFLPTLVPTLWSAIQRKVTDETARHRRLYIRLITELVLNGMGSETKQLLKTVAEVTGGVDGSYAVSDVNLFVSFIKTAGFEILGVTPTSVLNDIALLATEVAKATHEEHVTAGDTTTEMIADESIFIPRALVEKVDVLLLQTEEALRVRAVGPKITEVFLTHCSGAHETLSSTLVATHTKLQQLEKRCEQDRLLSGSLSEAREKGLMDARKLLESLVKSVEAISDVLARPLPELQDNEDDDLGAKGVGLELWTKGDGDEGTDLGPFDDEETRAFYCDIPDLLSTIPPALLGMSPEDIEQKRADNSQKYGAEFDELQEENAEAELAPSSEDVLEEEEGEVPGGSSEQDRNDGDGEDKDTPHYRLMVLLESELPECTRREQVDEIAEKFCVNHGSSKNARKRLTRTLFMVPRSRLDLLPFYSRLAAVIDRVFSDIAPPLVRDLEQQFHGQAKFKKNLNVENRLRTTRFLGELTKFRIAPPIMSLRCLRRCLDDFSGFNIDVACCLLESCGRYLVRTPHTAGRITTLLDAMTRIGTARNLDERAKALINSAMFSVKPPPTGPRRQARLRPPLEAYLHNLLLVRLVPEASSTAYATKQLLRFPWNDPSQDCGFLVCKYMMKACRKGRYKAITAVAIVAANLRRSQPEVAVRLLDSVLEELRRSLEHPDFRDQQRSITYAKLLGELFRSSVTSAHVVLQQLEDFVNIGHEIPDTLRAASAKLEDIFTVRQDGLSLPTIDSSKRDVSQTIQEDEALDEDAVDTTEEFAQPQQQVVAVSRHSKFDPRVSAQADPPNAVLRIQLVCTLLETALPSLVTTGNLPDLERFLASFQRYLFTKSSLPTEVEFGLLDTFDSIDSRWRKVAGNETGSERKSECGFPRYATWIDAHNATIAFDEADALLESKTRSRLEALAGFSQGSDATDSVTETESLNVDDIDSTGLSLEAEDDSIEDQLSLSTADTLNDADAEETEESGSQSEEMSQDGDDISDEGSSAGLVESEYEIISSDEEEMDEDALMRQLEEEEFERELRRMTMDALEKGKIISGRQVTDTMPSASQFIRKRAPESESARSGAPTALGGKQGVSFQLLKKGNKGKMEAKTLIVPSDTNLAKVATKQDDAAARERDLLKARVLQYEAESAEKEIAGGNVYLEQSKLQVIRNRPLSMEDIDRNFGSSRGDTPGTVRKRSTVTSGSSRSQQGPSGRGRGRGRGRIGGGRSLF